MRPSLNSGGADRLVGVTSAAGMAMLHAAGRRRGRARMRMLSDASPSPPARRSRFAPGGTHVMLTGLEAPLAPDEPIAMTFRFASAGPRTVDVAVVARGRPLMLGKLRLILWGLVALAAAALVFLLPRPRRPARAAHDRTPACVDRRAVHPGRQRRPAIRQHPAGGQAVRDLLRLHPLPRRLPDDAGAAGQAAPRARPGRRRLRDRLRHRRSRARRPRRSRRLCRAVRHAGDRADRKPGADRAGQEAICRLFAQRRRSQAATIASITPRACS